MTNLHIQRIGYALGAEITGVDLRKPLSDRHAAVIRQALLEHVLLCFPQQDLSPREMTDFAAQFGEVDDNRRLPFRSQPDQPEVTLVINKPVTLGEKTYSSTRADKWHSDLSYTDRPTTLSFLLAKELPDIGGDTMFCNTYTAYETLSPSFQRLVDPLYAIHDVSLAGSFAVETPEVIAARRRDNPPVAHPVVTVHPETNRKALYVGELVRGFDGMTEEEGRPILDFLNRHATRYEFVYRHRWSLGDLVMWDNRCAMHYAIRDYDQRQLRKMQRCCLLGPLTGHICSAA